MDVVGAAAAPVVAAPAAVVVVVDVDADVAVVPVDAPDTDPLVRRVGDGRPGGVVDTSHLEVVAVAVAAVALVVVDDDDSAGVGGVEDDPWQQHDWDVRGGAVEGVAGTHGGTGGAGGCAVVVVAEDGQCSAPAPSDGNRRDGWLLRW